MTDEELREQYERARDMGAAYMIDSEGRTWQIVHLEPTEIEQIGTWCEYEGLRRRQLG